MKITRSMQKEQRPRAVRRWLQMAVAVGALLPIFAGLMGVFEGAAMVDNGAVFSPSLDSHYRYLSGLLAGIGVGFWTTIPDIEKKTARFRLLTAVVFIGGLGRLYSLLVTGMPDVPMLCGLAMELVILPLLAVWQGAVARRWMR